jgi:hypothetical protein
MLNKRNQKSQNLIGNKKKEKNNYKKNKGLEMKLLMMMSLIMKKRINMAPIENIVGCFYKRVNVF